MTLGAELLAALYDPFMRATEEACLSGWRAELLGGVGGSVLEIGAGTGANLAHYPSAVERLVLTEPEPAMRGRLAQKAREVRPAAVSEVVDATGERLPFDDGTFDVVVSTLVLCSARDPGEVVREMRRVLRPGGQVVFLEHVAAEDPGRGGRAAWQRRLEPIWKRLAGGCHLTRRTEATLVAGGLSIESITRESMRRALPWIRPTIRGVARS